MDSLAQVRRLLAASSDTDNPTPEQLRDLFGRVERIAVVGLSRFPEKAARRVPSYLAAKGYDLRPINPNADRILGRTARDSLADVDEPVDLVVVFRPSAEAGAIVEQAVSRPERPAIWLQAGIRADPEVSAARGQGILAVQDLCTFTIHRALNS